MTKIVNATTKSNPEIAKRALVMIMFIRAIPLVTNVTTRFTTSITLKTVAYIKFASTVKTYTHTITKIVTTTTPIKPRIVINTPGAATRTRAIAAFAPKIITFALKTTKILLWMVSFMSEHSL